MKKVIFDLDGTLWETGDGYVYSYNKACQQLNIPEDKIRGREHVLGYLGMKLEELVMTIIPEAPDKMLLGQLLLTNVIEYLVTHPKTYGKNIRQLFEDLSKQYELYIISNCPRPFLETFYQVSGVKPFITADSTIECGEKPAAIKKFTNGCMDTAILVGDSTTDYEAIENHGNVQFVYAAYGYCKDCPSYNYYLEDLDDLPRLLANIQSMEYVLKGSPYQVVCNKGTSAAIIDKKDCYYFGFMQVRNPEDLGVVIETIKERCKGKPVIGPINGNSWYSYRLALNEYDFKLLPDCYGNPAVLKQFLDAGFVVAEKYISTLTTHNLDKWGQKNVKLPQGYEGKLVKGNDCYKYLEEIYQVSCECFDGHLFYEPIEFGAFKAMYEKFLPLCSPYLILILFEGKVIGYNFIYPDFENGFMVDKTTAISKSHRSRAVLLKLIELTNEVIVELGFDKVMMHYQHTKNIMLQSYFDGTVIKQKEYGVLKYESAE